ncbi:MAG TPA: NlpC/P60 family protein [Candidatus Nanopelagicales bacterium]|nr:NlpC/P60 family protein [Candidatus Nanopelagicales bacterium]
MTTARAALTTTTGAVLLSLLAGTAWAQTSPPPAAPTPSGSATSAEPSASASSDALPTADPSAPVDSAPDVRPVPPSTRTPLPAAPSASPGPTLAPATEANDGTPLAPGQTDDYLVASGARDAAALEVARRTSELTADVQEVSVLESDRASLAMDVARALEAATQTQRTTDDVVRDLYQQGDAGIGALATILAAGPDGFIERIDNARMATSTANGVVVLAQDARNRLATAQAAVAAQDVRLAQARGAVAAAQARLDAARIALATADARLTALGAAAPQVAIGADGCPTVDVPATLRDGSDRIGAAALCRSAVRQAATPQAALALTWAFQHLGAVYACKGVGRMEPWRADCSSFVSRAYHEGAGLGTAGDTWAASTRDMVPWDGVPLDPHYVAVSPSALRPGDLVLYDTCPQGGCTYKHVVMYLGSPDGGRTTWMLHTNACGDVAKVTAFWGFPTKGHPFLVARRVVALPGETVRTVQRAAARRSAAESARRATAVVSALLSSP